MPVRTAYAGAAVAGEVLTAANVNKLPGGWLGYAEVTANQGSIGTSNVDLTGLTVSVTVGTSRRIKITGHTFFEHGTTTGVGATLYIFEGATQLQRRSLILAAVTFPELVHAEVVLTPTAGAHTYKLVAASSASGLQMDAAATYPAFILVEDLGPAT